MDSWKFLLKLAVIPVISAVFLLIGYNLRWTGFQGEIKHKYEYSDNNVLTKIQREEGSPKKLWDWLQLLIIPVFIAVGAWWLNKVQKESEQKIETDRQNQNALEKYFDCMTNLLLEHKLRDSGEDAEVRIIARTRSLAILRTLDGGRKGQALQFLYEAELIYKDPKVDLLGADLSGAQLKGATLTKAELKGVLLDDAYLEGANLEEADLRGSKFIGADLTGAKIKKTNLQAANLSSAKLGGANLCEAILKWANLRNAKVSDATLNQAASLEFATRPNGDKFK